MSEYGTMTVHMQVSYRKPGHPNCSWSKMVLLCREQHVTLDQAKDVLAKWKECNPECIGHFSLALY